MKHCKILQVSKYAIIKSREQRKRKTPLDNTVLKTATTQTYLRNSDHTTE